LNTDRWVSLLLVFASAGLMAFGKATPLIFVFGWISKELWDRNEDMLELHKKKKKAPVLFLKCALCNDIPIIYLNGEILYCWKHYCEVTQQERQKRCESSVNSLK
jgi:hypothetical protein